MQGLNQLSSIYGIRQQAQNLQTGLYRQQEAQAGAVQAQQQARETQAGAQLLADPIGNGILESDGKTPTANAQSIIMRAMPTTGAAKYGDIVTAAQHKVDFDNAKMNLNLNERQAFNSAVAGAAAGATSPDEVRDSVGQFLTSVKGSPVEKDFQTLANTFLTGLNHVSSRPTIPGQPEPWRQFSTQYGRAVLGAPATVGAGGIGTPTAATINTGQTVQPGVVAPPLQGGGFTPGGPPVQLRIPPGTQQTLETDPQTNTKVWVIRDSAGNVVSTRPASEGVPPRAAPPTAQPAAPPSGGFHGPGTGTQIAGISERVQQAQNAANNTIQAQDALGRVKTILEGPNAPATGAAFLRQRDVQNMFSSIGVDTQGTTDMNSLVKNLARYEAARATAAGLGGTDAARELSHNGQPNVSIDNRALLGIVDQSLATEKAISSYANVQARTQDPKKQQANEASFRSIPNLIEGYQYGMTRNPDEANRFLGEHGLKPSDMARTRRAIKDFEAQ